MPDVRALTIDFKTATPESIADKINNAAQVMGGNLPDQTELKKAAAKIAKVSKLFLNEDHTDIVLQKNENNSVEFFVYGDDKRLPYEAPADIPRM